MESHLHYMDYIAIIALLLCTIGIGMYFALTGNKQRSTLEYFTGNQNLGFFSTVISISVPFLNGVALIGTPAEIYLYGGHYTVVNS